MRKDKVLELLHHYYPGNDFEKHCKNRIIDFIESNDIFWGKENLKGHLTGSAWIVNPDRNQALLTHHRKLDMWIQLGGHTEANEHILETALREAREESGLSCLKLLSNNIFDVDVHEIPPHGTEPGHFHYDIRFLLEGNENERFQVSQESKDLKWIRLHQVKEYTREESILRMVVKTLKMQPGSM